jgi:hypothetical protein
MNKNYKQKKYEWVEYCNQCYKEKTKCKCNNLKNEKE